MSLKTDNYQIGVSADPTKNFTLRPPAVPDGSLILSRGNAEAPGATILTINPQGGIVLPDGTAVGGNGRRNKVRNGNMRINQRGATNVTTDTQFVFDGWYSLINVAGNSCVVGGNGANNPSLTGGGNTYVQNLGTVKATLASGDYLGLQHRIEGLDIADLLWGTANAKPVMVSFRAYASQATTIGVSLRNGAAANRSCVVAVPLNAGYNTCVVPFPGCTDGTWPTDNSYGLSLSFVGAMGSGYLAPSLNAWNAGNYLSHASCSNICDTANRYFTIADVQLEAGTVATPYEWRDFSDELKRCKRYYQVFTGLILGGYNVSGSTHYADFQMEHMRASPTVTFSNISYSGTSSLNSNLTNGNHFRAYATWTATGYGYTVFDAALAAEL